jgi:lipopolysaccharide export LptBFGC system permease protein LptF
MTLRTRNRLALRANGVSSRRVIPPVLLFAALGMGLAGFASLRLTPLASRESVRIINQLMATQLSAEVQPRVFVEDFPNRILYLGDVAPGDPVRWHPVFMANLTAPDKRVTGLKEKGMGPMVFTAREALVISDPQQRRMQLSMRDAFTHEMSSEGTASDAFFPKLDMTLEAAPAREQALRSSAMNTGQLLRALKPGSKLEADSAVEYRIELHRRFALPVACIMLALVGIPLGIATRKGGRSAGYVNAVFLAFFCYYLSSVSLISLAKQGTLPVPVAIWLPDVVFGLAGLILIARMERPGDRDPLAVIGSWFGARFAAVKEWTGAKPASRRIAGWRLPLLPQLIDTYILSQFLFYMGLMLTSFVTLTLIWNFFELTGDMVRNKIPLSTMFTYLFFLTPALIYETLPVSVLVAVLVTFGVLSRQNEITAFKASGVSLRRLAAPILIGCTLFSAGLFAFDFYYVPGANRRQDALRDQIKGRATQTYMTADRKWIMGHGSRIYYYRYFDPSAEMLDVNVFELDSKTFRMRRCAFRREPPAALSASVRSYVAKN